MAIRSPLGMRLRGKTAENNNETPKERTRLPMLRGLSLSPRSSPRRTSIENGEKRPSRRRNSGDSGRQSFINGSMPGSMEIGLENLGNTCFMNSSLQCLLHIQPLVSYFLANENNLLLNKKSPTKGLLASSFAQLVKEISNAQAGTVIAPIDFQKVVCRHAPHLLDNQQQDCQEFLHFLLDGMSEDLCRDKRPSPINTTTSALELTAPPLSNDISSQQVSRKKNGEKLISSRISGRISQSLSFTEGTGEDTLVVEDDGREPLSSSKITAAQRLRDQVALAGNIVSPVHVGTNEIDTVSTESNNNTITTKNRGFHHPQRIRRPGQPPTGNLEKGSSNADMMMTIESSNHSPPNHSPPNHTPPHGTPNASIKQQHISRKDAGSPILDLALTTGIIGHSAKTGSFREVTTSGSVPNSSRKLSPRMVSTSPRVSTRISSPLLQKDAISKEDVDRKEEKDKAVEMPAATISATTTAVSAGSTPRKSGMRLKFPNINLRSIAIGSREGANSHNSSHSAAANVPESDSADTGMTRSSIFGSKPDGNHHTTSTISPEALQKSRQVAWEQSKKSWEGYLAMNDSVVTDLFAGQLQSTIECLTCHHRSFCFDSFLDLSVPIPKGPEVAVPVKSTWRRSTPTNVPPTEPTKCPLEECIAKFAGEEILDGENMFTCEMCKEKRKCTKKLSIFKYPRILVIHIMRFRYNEASREKLSTDVKFPMRGLSLSPYLSEDRPNGTIPPPPQVTNEKEIKDTNNSSSASDIPTGIPSTMKKTQSQSSDVNPVVVSSSSPSPPPTSIPTVIEKNHHVVAGIVDSIVDRVEEIFQNLNTTMPTSLTIPDPSDLPVNVVNVAKDGPMDDIVMDDDSHPATPTTQLPLSEKSPPEGLITTSNVTTPTITKDSNSVPVIEVNHHHTIPTSSSSVAIGSTHPTPSSINADLFRPSFNADLFPPMYDLIGVSNHCGTLNGGHYVAHVDTNQHKSHHFKSHSYRQQQQQHQQQQRNQHGEETETPGMSRSMGTSNNNRKEDEENGSIDSRWVCFNDDHVSLASTSSVVGPSAYVLFYRLREN